MLPSLTLVTDAAKKPVIIPLCEREQFPSLPSSQMAVRLSDLPASWRERCQCHHLCLEVLGAPSCPAHSSLVFITILEQLLLFI